MRQSAWPSPRMRAVRLPSRSFNLAVYWCTATSYWRGRRTVENYGRTMTYGQTKHTVPNKWLAIGMLFELFADAATKAKRLVVEYVVLDALIGTTDRHHENRGAPVDPSEESIRLTVARSFDPASSLVRELRDTRRDGLRATNHVGHPAERGQGGIYGSESDGRRPSPLVLVRRATMSDAGLFRPALAKTLRLEPGSICEPTGRIPESWMTVSARRFAGAVTRYTRRELQRIQS